MDAITESPGRYWPVSSKYDAVDRKYKFFKASHAKQMQRYYPLTKLGQSSYLSQQPNATTFLKSQILIASEIAEFTTNSNVKKINDLPNDVLLIIFDYCHPIDLIHCFSLVSRRWNYLANHSALFTEVRVLINDLSLKYGSVKKFFHRTSHYLRKLCIHCSVFLPSAQVNALFDICFPNVIHLDIGSFKKMNTTLLKKLSDCFPNVETLHMDELEICSLCGKNGEEWNEVVEMLFGDENIFPKVQNFFMGNIQQYCRETGAKLSVCKRPLNLLYIHTGAARINFSEIKTSPWTSTLTELHLGYCIKNEDFRHIADLHNLKRFSLAACFYASDDDIAPLKNLYNLEELRMSYDCEDSNLSTEGMINLFTLPVEEPEKSFPYKLKHLEIAFLHACKTDLLKAINQKYVDFLFFLLFKHLVFLDLSHLGDCYKDEVWNNLNNDNLPNLHLLKLHGNKVNIENLQRLNLRRPKLLISTKRNYFINWTETEFDYVFNDIFDGDIIAIVNDLCQIDGLHNFTID